MSLQVEKLEKNMAKLTIEVPAEELEAAIEKAYQKNKGKIQIPGFRKGKVPRKMIEQMYGKEFFYEDAANELIPDAYEKAVEECTETIVSSPKVDVSQIEAGKPFIFTAEVALKPEVALGKYKGVEVEKIDTSVTGGKILGGKTGYTSEAGLCLASFAEIYGREYILVTAGAAGNTGNPLHVQDAVTIYNRLGNAIEAQMGDSGQS